jgi:hypothetical protein
VSGWLRRLISCTPPGHSMQPALHSAAFHIAIADPLLITPFTPAQPARPLTKAQRLV